MQDNITIDPIPLEPRPAREPRHTRLKEPVAAESGLAVGRRPDWLRVKLNQNESYWKVKSLVRGQTLHTVCEEAMCPNLGECWGRGTATFLLMGDICTRACKFCNVKSGKPEPLDEDEPRRIAESVRQMNLRHAVLTSVDRDDQPDGGAHIFANAIREIRAAQPGCTIEVLIPDFKADPAALQLVMDARPEILNHNTETVPRLSRWVRPQASPARSLAVLRMAKEMNPEGLTKSGVMVGLGETWDELLEVMDELRTVDVDILTIGQYLQPTKLHLPIERYYHPDEFVRLREEGERRGFKWVESGPLVRSSYHADGQARMIASKE
ncbi:MAG: Lipoyl synthase [Chloroflexi bacterium ADurb.Bin325]|nr:MAG: Lipoyl synthase [Chloroflexi bacterium ADurb.Bin325]